MENVPNAERPSRVTMALPVYVADGVN